MNLLDRALMAGRSFLPGYCVTCGAPYPTKHHVVPRSHGGTDGPMLHLCGDGVRGCHGKAHEKRLHFMYTEGWEYLVTDDPTKYDEALTMDGWRRLP